MADSSSDIVELVRGIVTPLVEDADAVQVTSTIAEDGCEIVEISVAEADAGKVIGRQGRVIKSIRVLARAAASATHGNVEVELVEA